MSRRRFLEVLDKARSDEVPWSLVPTFERVAKKILDGRPILITTTPEMNYIVDWGQDPVTIYFPKLHRANGFLHVLIGHELFHPVLSDYFKSERPMVVPKLRADCQDFLNAQGLPNDLFSSQRLDAALNYAYRQWEKGLTELMCDMGAASIFGPSALWTVSGYAATSELNSPPSEVNQFYPPWRLRLRVIRNYLDEVDDAGKVVGNLIQALVDSNHREHADALKNCFEREVQDFAPTDLAFDPMRALSIKVYEHIESSIPTAQEFVKNIAMRFPQRWTNSVSEIPKLISRLGLMVPPSEIIEPGSQKSTASSMSAVVLACWLERLVMEESGKLDLLQFRRLCRLMLKAIEDGELKREFSSWNSAT
jgi:hypothetical protein